MRLCYVLLAMAVAAIPAPAAAQAQVYAAESYPGYIVSYDGTVGTIVNPDTMLTSIEAIALDHEGRLLLASTNGETDVIRFDPVTQAVELLDPYVAGSLATGIIPDLGDDIYVLKTSNWKGGGRSYDSWIGLLRDGVGPADSIYAFEGQPNLLDIEIWPFGERAGNLLVLVGYGESGAEIYEIERTEEDSFNFYQTLVDEYSIGAEYPEAFEVLENGDIIVLDYSYGFFYLDMFYGYAWSWGNAVGPGLVDMDRASDGTIYVVNAWTDSIEHYDQSGYRIPPNFSGGISNPTCIVASGYTPTPEGEDVLVVPGENIEITYEEVTSSGFTHAEVATTTSRVSPEGNYLPDHAALPGTKADDFSYVGLSTDAVYSGLIQVDVLLEGSRMFYASGVGDTFRDFTVVGSIDDARGTIPRFSELPASGDKLVETGPTEVVLVEDTRTLSEATLYKFWRMNLAMQVPDNMPGGDPCPWEFIEWLQKYPRSARAYYDVGNYSNALSDLAIMNGLIRSHAGWCIPDSSDDPLGNMVGKLLAHSKTLMYSIELESDQPFTGIDESSSVVSLSATSPAQGECRLSLSGPVGAEVTARIYSVTGRLVATVYDGRLPEGGQTVVWNGVDTSGSQIASGVYFVRVESGGDVLNSKVVFIR
ncbi:MAG: hypothetical protein JXA57_18860 [Armatimonadetes bacterium]|nr:hypothetical protein [Armatimonadota bacterium]